MFFGYTCFNDVTARDLQQRDGQWTRAKGFDTFAPFGPWIQDGAGPVRCPHRNLSQRAIKTKGTTADQIFKAPETISFISQVMTLLPAI